MVTPYVSILIVAHRRREFLERAVRSAVTQSADPESYEVVVLKNFPDRWVDELSAVGRIRVIEYGDQQVGACLALGVRACRGRVVCFLDDDDAFEPDKVKMVKEMFESNANLVYFHNGYCAKRDDGSIVRSSFGREFSRTYSFQANELDESTARDIISKSLATNLSSVSLRVPLGAENLESLEQIRGTTDYFVFYMAMNLGGELRFDRMALTTYFVHSGHTRPTGNGSNGIGKLITTQLEVHAYGANKASSSALRELARTLQSEWLFLQAATLPARRVDVLACFSKFFARSFRSRPRFVVLSLPLLFVSVTYPQATLSLILKGQRLVPH